MEPADTLNVQVVYCPPGAECDLVPLILPPGSTLAEALAASGLLQRHRLELEGLRAGVWSKLREMHTLLREGDRVEIYRALKVDPKEARRQRYQQHRESQAARERAKAQQLAARAAAGSPPAGDGQP